MRRRLVGALPAMVAAVALALTACGSGDPLKEGTSGSGDAESGPIVIGSADFTENELLMEIYAGALRTTGAQVKTKPRISARELVIRALQDKSLTLIPEYSGNLLYYVDKSATVTKPDEVYTALKEKLPSGLEVLERSTAEDKDVLVVTNQTADQLGVKSIEDLGPKCSQVVLGAAGEWKDRWEKKIKELYGCTFKEIRTTDAGGPVTVEALRGGQVQVANLFTTLSAIDSNGFIELADPKQMYPAQNVVPLARKGVLNDKAKQALAKVGASLDTDKLADLNRRLEVDKETVPDVARGFLESIGFRGF